MAVKAGEQVLVVTDGPCRKIGEVLWLAAKEAGAEAVLLEMEPRENHGQEPPGMVAAAMKSAQVVLLPTFRSLSHTRARKEANQAGARVGSMPMITEDMLARTLSGDYHQIEDSCHHYARLLSEGKMVRIISPGGTDITFSIEGREGWADTGMYHEPRSFGNLPAGEAFVAPVEGTASGMVVIDGSMAGIGRVDVPIELIVENGLAVDIKGGEGAARLKQIVDKHGQQARNIAELGIGLNPNAMLTGLTLEDEKIAGTVHLALGDNSTFGGTVEVDSHLDGVILNPTLEIDGKIIIQDGKLLL